MNSELWATIRRLYEVEKLSKSTIARRLSIHRWTVRQLLKEIKEQGYTGSNTILLEYLRTIRPERHPRVFLRLETQPGEFAQVDWMNVWSITIGNAKRKLSCFVMVLSYSRMIYLEFTLSQRLEDFLQAHLNAFDFFGGVPDKINYDNLKTV